MRNGRGRKLFIVTPIATMITPRHPTSNTTSSPTPTHIREPCDAVHSTCNGRVAECIGRGPAWPDDVASCRIIAERQAEAAEKLTRDAASRTGAAGGWRREHYSCRVPIEGVLVI